jgi:ribosomal protein S18 acetylase RimI-like enzyme
MEDRPGPGPALVVRPYVPADEDVVVALWEACALTRPWIDSRADIALKLRHQPAGFLVGTVGDEVVATVVAGFDGRRGWLNYLAVHPARRGRGYGRQLVEAAEADLAARGCPKVNLQVRHDNAEVIAFYEHLGYADDHVVTLGRRIAPPVR